VRTTCLSSVWEGITRQSICPLTGRVGKRCGSIWPDQAPAQFTIFAAWKAVLVVATPVARPSVRVTAVTSSPEEKSTLRWLAVFHAAVVSAFSEIKPWALRIGFGQGRFQCGEVCGKETRSLGLVKMLGRREQDRPLVAEVDFHS